jgi:hypothetical protein
MKVYTWLLGMVVLLMISGCAKTVVTPIEIDVKEYVVKAAKKDVFDSALVVAQDSNLQVTVIEKESGLIRFESTYFSARQLERLCQFPLVDADSGKPTSNFREWNEQSQEKKLGPVKGLASITFLIRELGEDVSTVRVQSNWTVGNTSQTYPCNSTEELESQLIEKIKLDV